MNHPTTNLSKVCKTKNKKALNSKKHVQKKLKQGWVDRVFEIQLQRTQSQPQRNQGFSILAIAICIATGLRPAELKQGVVLRQLACGNIEVEIYGAKLIRNEFGELDRGIEVRWLTINPDYSLASAYLQHTVPLLLKRSNSSEYKFEYNDSTLRKITSSLGREYLDLYQPKQKELILSPYVFRHQLSASLKSCTMLDNQERAMVLGHLSIDSMQSYSRAFRTKSPIKPILKVRASQAPRPGAARPYLTNTFSPTKLPHKITQLKLASSISGPSL